MANDIYVEMPSSNEKNSATRLNVSEVSGADSPQPKLERGGRRRTIPVHPIKPGVGYDGEANTVNALGKLYVRIMNFNVVTRNLIYIVPVAVLLAIPLIVFATVASEARSHGVRLLGLFVWLQVLWWSFWVTKLMAQMLPYIFQVLCGFVSSGTRKYRLLIRAMEIPIAFLLWTIVCYASVPLITVFDQSLRGKVQWVKTFQRFVLASMAVAALFVAEKLIIQLISVNYHRRQFNTRVNESKLKVRMLDALMEISMKMFPMNCPAFEKEDFEILTGIDAAQQEAIDTKLVGGLALFGENLQSTVGNITSEITGAKSGQQVAIHNMVVEALEIRKSSEALGRRLWMSLVEEGKEALYRTDIEELLGEDRKVEANEIFDLLDQDRNGDVSLDEMIMSTMEIARERKAIARSMHDVGQAVKVLDRFLFLVALVFLGIVYAAFFSESFAKYLFTIGTQIAAVSFAIAATVQEFLGSCIFVFVKHPYDVGDRILISDVQMIVEHISLLYSTFKRVDNGRMIQIPNIKNNDNWIDNITRSKQMKEQIAISVNAETSFADIEVFKQEMTVFLSADANKRDFFPEVEVQITECKDLKQIDMIIGVSHKSNWAIEDLRLMRRNKLMTAILSSLRNVPIYPAGTDSPLSIRRPTKELVDQAREIVRADRDAFVLLQEQHDGFNTAAAAAAAEANEAKTSMATAVDAQSLRVQQGRASMDSRRSGFAGVGGRGQQHSVGLRRASARPDGLE